MNSLNHHFIVAIIASGLGLMAYHPIEAKEDPILPGLTITELLQKKACDRRYQSKKFNREGKEFVRFHPGSFAENRYFQSTDEGSEAIELIAVHPQLTQALQIRTLDEPPHPSVIAHMRRKAPSLYQKLEEKNFVQYHDHVFLKKQSPSGASIVRVKEVEFPSPETLNQVRNRLGFRRIKIKDSPYGFARHEELIEAFIDSPPTLLLESGRMAPHDYGFHLLGVLFMPDSVLTPLVASFRALHQARKTFSQHPLLAGILKKTEESVFFDVYEDMIPDLHTAFLKSPSTQKLKDEFEELLSVNEGIFLSPIHWIRKKLHGKNLNPQEIETLIRDLITKHPELATSRIDQSFESFRSAAIEEMIQAYTLLLREDVFNSKIGLSD